MGLSQSFEVGQVLGSQRELTRRKGERDTGVSLGLSSDLQPVCSLDVVPLGWCQNRFQEGN